MRSPKKGRIQASAWSTFAATLRWSKVAPLATPVVPPVYCRNATSSSEMETGFGGVRAPSAITRVNGTDFGRLKGFTAFFTCRDTRLMTAPFSPMRSPGVTITMVCRSRDGSASSTVCPKFSRTKRILAPESINCR